MKNLFFDTVLGNEAVSNYLLVLPDTMGAGDSFWAAFLVNWFKDVQTHGAPDVQGAMRAASAFAGKNVCRRGSLGFGMPADLAALGEIRPL